MLTIRTDMAMSATLAGFAKRYSAKYIQTGRSVVNEFRRPSPSLDRADSDGVDPAAYDYPRAMRTLQHRHASLGI